MDFFKGNLAKLLLLVLVAIVFAAFKPELARRIAGECRDLLSSLWAPPESALHPGAGAGASPAESPSAPAAATPGESPSAPATAEATPAALDPLAQAQLAVESYMRKNAAAQCTLSFLGWSDFSTTGPMSAITLRYRVQQPSQDDVLASVRFTLEAGNVVKRELIATGLQVLNAPVGGPVRIASAIPQVVDRFSEPLAAAEMGSSMTLELSDAYSLAQLDQAKQQARAEGKPLGFIMVWGQFFDHEADPRSKGSDSALVHFYEVFHQALVLVFVRHETELGLVPDAVKKGFNGPDEGGYAPNMAVTDATATEFIVEIPFRALDGAGREPLFAAGGKQIDLWLATHPDAMPTPAGGNQ